MAAEIGNAAERIVVCVGYPDMQSPRHLERLRAIDPRIDPRPLPVDPGDARTWAAVYPGEPHAEPPPWAASVASERCRALEAAQVLIASTLR